jgi:predicted amidohydrolase YtcJ
MKEQGLLMIFLVLSVLVLFFACGAGPPQKQKADLVLRGGKVVTVDESFSIAESVAVAGDRIIYVGPEEKIDEYISAATEVIDCSGMLVLPGLIDSHAHLHSLGNELSYFNITGTKSFQQIVQMVESRVKSLKPGEWIIGGRWDQNDWKETSFPVHEKLSRISPQNPVYLSRIDGNAAFANAKALSIAGITRDTPDPIGGMIHRRPDGSPSGVLINRAMNLVLGHFPEETEEEKEKKFLAAVKRCLEFGLTGIHEAGVGPDEIAMYKSLIDEDRLPLRIYAMLGEQEMPPLEGDLVDYFKKNRLEQYGGHMLSIRAVKLFFDGALGSRGAAFFEPYSDDRQNTGLLRITPEYITKVTEAALEAEMGVCTHCIGIRGNRLCLDAYERALEKYPVRDHRLRIEHAQIVRPEDIQKFVFLEVIPAMQPTHCTSDMGFVETRVGLERASGAYAWRFFLDAGCIIPCGSDFPVESPDPLLGIYAAVSRQDRSGNPPEGWYPEQVMTIEEAIRGFTSWSAFAAFQENILGSIMVGKLADFTLLDGDILDVRPSKILDTRAAMTIVGGKIRWRK